MQVGVAREVQSGEYRVALTPAAVTEPVRAGHTAKVVVLPNTPAHALTDVTLPYDMALAGHGTVAAVGADPALARGVNVAGGAVVLPEVPRAHGRPAVPLTEVLS